MWTSESFRGWLADQLGELPKPVGLFVDSDWTGLEVIEACAEAGLPVPEQVAVVSCYNMSDVCEGTPVPLSNVDVDRERCGYEAAALLDRLMKGTAASPTEKILVPPKGVVLRDSSDTLAIEHLGVARALRIIKKRFVDPALRPEPIAAEVGMSRDGLDAAFRKCVGSPVAAAILRSRLDHAKELLQPTDHRVEEIAAKSGFRSATVLSKRLHADSGVPATEWRRQHQGTITAG
jgi:LacI family transcriptional regulator